MEQWRIAAANLLGAGLAYAGEESMNSLKHLGLPLVAVGAFEGDRELRWAGGGSLRKAFLSDGRLVGFRLTGDISGAGHLRSLMLRRLVAEPAGPRLIAPGYRVAARMPEAAFTLR